MRDSGGDLGPEFAAVRGESNVALFAIGKGGRGLATQLRLSDALLLQFHADLFKLTVYSSILHMISPKIAR
jgi:hypothetical protein